MGWSKLFRMFISENSFSSSSLMMAVFLIVFMALMIPVVLWITTQTLPYAPIIYYNYFFLIFGKFFIFSFFFFLKKKNLPSPKTLPNLYVLAMDPFLRLTKIDGSILIGGPAFFEGDMVREGSSAAFLSGLSTWPSLFLDSF